MLSATNITVSYGQNRILHHIDFTAQAGEFTAIVGPNGSGKTTLMRALTGEVPYTGKVILNGTNIARQKPWELAVQRGVLPQATSLAFPFTVTEVVRLGLNAGLSASLNSGGHSNQISVPQALERVGLGGFAGRYYQELSGGEQQRVQLARVLLQVWEPILNDTPRWLFLDEPVSSLDIGHQLLVMQIARDFADAGGGVIAVMHDLNLTAMFANNIALISQGHLAGQGAPAAILTDDMLSDAYHCNLRVNTSPDQGTFLLPHAASFGAAISPGAPR